MFHASVILLVALVVAVTATSPYDPLMGVWSTTIGTCRLFAQFRFRNYFAIQVPADSENPDTNCKDMFAGAFSINEDTIYVTYSYRPSSFPDTFRVFDYTLVGSNSLVLVDTLNGGNVISFSKVNPIPLLNGVWNVSVTSGPSSVTSIVDVQEGLYLTYNADPALSSVSASFFGVIQASDTVTDQFQLVYSVFSPSGALGGLSAPVLLNVTVTPTSGGFRMVSSDSRLTFDVTARNSLPSNEFDGVWVGKNLADINSCVTTAEFRSGLYRSYQAPDSACGGMSSGLFLKLNTTHARILYGFSSYSGLEGTAIDVQFTLAGDTMTLVSDSWSVELTRVNNPPALIVVETSVQSSSSTPTCAGLVAALASASAADESDIICDPVASRKRASASFTLGLQSGQYAGAQSAADVYGTLVTGSLGSLTVANTSLVSGTAATPAPAGSIAPSNGGPTSTPTATTATPTEDSSSATATAVASLVLLVISALFVF